ncbi:TPA: hypothetical protein ACGUPU_004097 [Vibrio vulnificus]
MCSVLLVQIKWILCVIFDTSNVHTQELMAAGTQLTQQLYQNGYALGDL